MPTQKTILNILKGIVDKRAHPIHWTLCLLMVLGLFSFSQAQTKVPQIAVMPVSGDEDLTAQQLYFLTGQLSAELVKTKAFTVLDRSQMEFILKEQGFQQSGACNSSECQVQMGQLLGVEYIVAGTLVRFGSKYALRADYIDVGTSKVVSSVDQDESGDLEDVYKPLCQSVGQKLAQAVRGKKQKTEASALDSAIAIPAPKQLAKDPQLEPVKNIAPEVDAPSRPLSSKRKLALALWGSSLLGSGAGWYFNSQGIAASKDYDDAVESKNKSDADDAFDRTESALLGRNASYGISIGALVAGMALWFWPE